MKNGEGGGVEGKEAARREERDGEFGKEREVRKGE